MRNKAHSVDLPLAPRKYKIKRNNVKLVDLPKLLIDICKEWENKVLWVDLPLAPKKEKMKGCMAWWVNLPLLLIDKGKE